MGPETKFKMRVQRDLKTVPSCWFTKIQQRVKRGDPDFLVCLGGFFVGLELKASAKAKIDKLQHYTLEKIRESGGIGIVAIPENWETVFELLKDLSHGKDFRVPEAKAGWKTL